MGTWTGIAVTSVGTNGATGMKVEGHYVTTLCLGPCPARGSARQPFRASPEGLPLQLKAKLREREGSASQGVILVSISHLVAASPFPLLGNSGWSPFLLANSISLLSFLPRITFFNTSAQSLLDRGQCVCCRLPSPPAGSSAGCAVSCGAGGGLPFSLVTPLCPVMKVGASYSL